VTHARDVATRCLTPRRFFRGWYPHGAWLEISHDQLNRELDLGDGARGRVLGVAFHLPGVAAGGDMQAISPPMLLAMQGRDPAATTCWDRSLCREQRPKRCRVDGPVPPACQPLGEL